LAEHKEIAMRRGYGTVSAGDWSAFAAKCSCLLFESNLFIDFIVAFNKKLGLG